MTRDIDNYPILTDEKISSILDETIFKEALVRYKTMKEEFHRNIPLKESMSFKDAIEHLYTSNTKSVLKSLYNRYYDYLEEIRYRKDISYEEIFANLQKIKKFNYSRSNWINYVGQMIFASKMLHAINDDEIIVNYQVAKCFGIRCPNDIESFNYNNLKDILIDYMNNSEEANRIIKIFDYKYPNSNISNIKKIDFVLWMYGAKQ